MPLTVWGEMGRKKIPQDQEFGERLEKMRGLRGMTQLELAEASGTSQRAISHYETCMGYAPAPQLAAIAKTLKTTTDEFLGLRPPNRTRASTTPRPGRSSSRSPSSPTKISAPSSASSTQSAADGNDRL